MLMVIALLFYLALPGLRDELWQDESYTLYTYADKGLLHPFSSYERPNNHILFSASLVLWSKLSTSLVFLRLLPFLFFLAATLLLAEALRRYCGVLAAGIGTFLFVSSHVVLGFATELRGYGPSWLPVAGGMLLLPLYMKSGRRLFAVLYLLCAVLAIGILPSNVLVFAIFMCWAIFLPGKDRADGEAGIRDGRKRLLLPLAAMPAGVISYVGVLGELGTRAQHAWSPWSFGDIFGHFLWATFHEWIWLLAPFLMLGIFSLLRSARASALGDPARSQLALLLATLLLPLFSFALLYLFLGHLPFPRCLVPLLPIWYGLAGLLLARGIESVVPVDGKMARACSAAALLVFASLAIVREQDNAGYAARHLDTEAHQDLYDQYYHQAYRIRPVFASIVMRSGKSRRVVISDYNGEWSIGPMQQVYRGPNKISVHHFESKSLKNLMELQSKDAWFLVVANSEAHATRMWQAASGDFASSVRRLSDHGFFKLFEIVPRSL